MDLTLSLHKSIAEIPPEDWLACAGADNPFVSHAFLAAVEESGSANARTGWGADALRDEGVVSIETDAIPTEVQPAVNAVWRGSRLLTPIGGGVTLQPRIALDAPNLIIDEEGVLVELRGGADSLPAGRWWWD